MMSINLGRIGIVVQSSSGPIVRHLFWELSRAVADGLIDNVFYTMGKPEVSDGELQEIVDQDYRPEGNCSDEPVGDGGTADAIQNEVETGEPTCDRFHDKKGRSLRNRYRKWIRRQMNNYPVERRASEEDINTAIDLHNQLVDALERVDGAGNAGQRFATPYSHPPNP